MGTSRHRRSPGHPYLHYYRCFGRENKGEESCPQRQGFRAENVEGMVWRYVRAILTDLAELRADLDAMIELERDGETRRDPEREAKAWLGKLAEVDAQRSRAQDLVIEGLIGRDELRAKLATLEEVRRTAHNELRALDAHRERIEGLERDRDALLDSLAALSPDAIDALSPEQRQNVYKMLGLQVFADLDGGVQASLPYGDLVDVCESEVARARSRADPM
jgi:hypothetical protein